MLLTNDAGAPTGESFEYDSYGNPLQVAGNPTTPFRWHGALGVMTEANGLVYMRARYYHPRLMRFLNEDPIGFAGGMNWYAFVGNNPMGFVDPWGLCRDGQTWYQRGGSWFLTQAKAGIGPILDIGNNLATDTGWALAKVGQIGRWALGEPNRWWESGDEISVAFAGARDPAASMDWYDSSDVVIQFTKMTAEAFGPAKLAQIKQARLARTTFSAAEKTALEVAQGGGRHAGFLRNYMNKSPSELRKGITSIEKQIAEHQAKIANPEKAIPNFRQLDPRQQKALLENKWPSDIQRQQQQLEILRGLLGTQ
jgi:RHS repeat-associated protein